MRNKELLGDLAPKNKEEERIFQEVIKRLLQKIALERKAKQQGSFKDSNGLFMQNKKLREHSDGFSKDREFRMIALIPADMVEIAKKMYGEDVITNREKFKQAFVKDEVGRYCLTVDPSTI